MIIAAPAEVGMATTWQSRGRSPSAHEPFGPVMLARAAYLEAAGLAKSGQRHEDLVVIRADRG